MKLELNINGNRFYKTCKTAFIWTGSLKNAPETIIDLFEDGLAYVSPTTKALIIGPINGYRIADVGDLVIIDPNSIHRYSFNIISGVEYAEPLDLPDPA